MADNYQTREERRKQQEAQKKAQKLAKKNNKPKNNSKSKTVIKRIFIAFVALGIVGLIGGLGTFAFMVKGAPELDENLLKYPISSEIYDMDGKLIAEIGSEKRDYVEYDEIPELVRNAIIATEDVRFFEHNGIDLLRLGSAVVANFTDGFGSQGASTITQQVIKNSFLTPEKTLKRKSQEAWLAFQLEQKYTKEQIFEMYVNKNWMGSGGHGIATAAKTYFGKDLDELTLAEAATIAGIPQSPANYDPFNHPDRSEKRRNVVLSLMHQHGFINEKQKNEAQNQELTASLVPEEDRAKGGIPYDAFIGQAIKEIKEKYPDLDPFSDGLKIYTTIDTNAQDYVDQLMNSNEIVKFPDDKMQAGITLLDTKTGAILAMGGGRNQTVKFGFNYATDAKRQPGSTIKPILDYGPAIEYLKWGTYHPLDDKPYTYSDGTPINNWDNKHMGVMTMRRALALSRNIPALQALQAATLEKAQEFAKGIGIELEEIYEPYAIGGFGKGVSSLEMAGAYSAFGNNGFYTEPYSVTHVELRDKTKLEMKPETTLVMQDYTAFMITDMLKDVVRSGTGTNASVPGVHVAGKTGTTNYTKEDRQKYKIPQGAVPDSWFVGYSPNYTIAVWTGYDNNKKNWLVGNEQKISQYLFKNLMAHVSKNKQKADFSVPSSVEKVTIEKGSMPAKLASDFTPESEKLVEYAIKGHAPTEISNKYKKLEAPSNFKAKYDKKKNVVVLTWKYPDDDVEFEIFVKRNGRAEQQLPNTTEKQVSFQPEGRGIYTIKVAAIRGENKGPQTTATITVVGDLDFDFDFDLDFPFDNRKKDDKNKDTNEDDNGELDNNEGDENQGGNNEGNENNGDSQDPNRDNTEQPNDNNAARNNGRSPQVQPE